MDEHTHDESRGDREAPVQRRDPGTFGGEPAGARRRDPLQQLMRRVSGEMERLMQDWLGGEGPRRGFAPELEVRQVGEQMIVSIDLPGMRPEDVTIEIDDRTLCVRGERRRAHTVSEGGVRRSERQYGRFERLVDLPPGADPDGARAWFRDGVLEVSIPAPPRAGVPRRVPVQGEAAPAPAASAASPQAPGSGGAFPAEGTGGHGEGRG